MVEDVPDSIPELMEISKLIISPSPLNNSPVEYTQIDICSSELLI